MGRSAVPDENVLFQTLTATVDGKNVQRVTTENDVVRVRSQGITLYRSTRSSCSISFTL